MKNLLLVGWLLLPIGAWAYHEGPGQDREALEQANAVLQRAHEDAAAANWSAAVKGYEKGLGLLPKERTAETRRVRLELCKARMQDRGLPEARDDLEILLGDVTGDRDADPALVAETRHALANAQYYMTWLKRLEGLTREEWEPEIEAARQNFRLLAEQAPDRAKAAVYEGDLEAAIRLARLDIEDLQGLPLPSE